MCEKKVGEKGKYIKIDERGQSLGERGRASGWRKKTGIAEKEGN